jgi:hypothetical protein
MSDSDPTTLQVRYENTSATYANQIVVNANREDLILNFSSGAIHDPQSGDAILPIHSRVALTWSGAARLRSLIDQAMQSQAQQQQQQAAAAAASTAATTAAGAEAAPETAPAKKSPGKK